MMMALKRQGSPEVITTDGLRSYNAVLTKLGNKGATVALPQAGRQGRSIEYTMPVESIVANSPLNGETVRLGSSIREAPRLIAVLLLVQAGICDGF